VNRGLWFAAGFIVGVVLTNESPRLVIWWAER
jgi:hypothetical protein